MSEEVNAASVSPSPTAQATGPRQLRRVKLTDEQLETISREDLVKNWKELDLYVDLLESQTPSQEAILHLRECEERIKQQYSESTHREKVLVRRLATKEQEMQEYVSQIAELKSDKAPGAAALRSALLDPAVNLLLQRLRQELVTTKARLDETQNELSAWKFTPDSNTGKRLMAKCRLLYQENEELGRIISSGRLAKLEGDLALQKSFSDEVKKSQSELDEFLQDLDEDVEGMQSTIYYLQQELRKAKDALASLQQENEILKNGPSDAVVEPDLGLIDTVTSTAAESPKLALLSSEPSTSPSPQPHSTVELKVESEVEPKPQTCAPPVVELDESANQHPPSPPAAPIEPQAWQHNSDSSDSGGLILNIEAEDDVVNSPKRKRSFTSAKREEPALKKLRHDSELSLHYSEEDENLLLKESVEEEVTPKKSPMTKIIDEDDSSDDTPLSIVRRDSQ